MADPVTEIRAALEAAVAPQVDPDTRVTMLDYWTGALTDLLGLAETYRDDTELARGMQEAQDAAIAEQLVRRGIVSEEGLAALGYQSGEEPLDEEPSAPSAPDNGDQPA